MSVLHTVKLTMTPSDHDVQSSGGLAAVGQLIPATLTIKHTRSWDSSGEAASPGDERALDFSYEVHANPDDWLVAGRRRARFRAKVCTKRKPHHSDLTWFGSLRSIKRTDSPSPCSRNGRDICSTPPSRSAPLPGTERRPGRATRRRTTRRPRTAPPEGCRRSSAKSTTAIKPTSSRCWPTCGAAPSGSSPVALDRGSSSGKSERRKWRVSRWVPDLGTVGVSTFLASSCGKAQTGILDGHFSSDGACRGVPGRVWRSVR